jgi:hypothetical protein
MKSVLVEIIVFIVGFMTMDITNHTMHLNLTAEYAYLVGSIFGAIGISIAHQYIEEF